MLTCNRSPIAKVGRVWVSPIAKAEEKGIAKFQIVKKNGRISIILNQQE
ncbi:hypothetical protein CCP3SC5AM1_40022 [Gammaproteobacteria bacterium]